jgi:hypothetical protein
MGQTSSETYCGRTFTFDELSEIKEIVSLCQGNSRTELANTICELYSWKRPSGKLKTVEGRQFLEYLEGKGMLYLPQRKERRPKGIKTKVQRTELGKEGEALTGKASAYKPIFLRRVESKEQRDLWYEYIDRYHYLGYQVPFGAQLRYFIETGKSGGCILGCLQFSSSAWKMSDRDKWIGWDDNQRQQNLQKVINNSRFLLLPWVKVKNLASTVLSLACGMLADDWESLYGYRPVLLETLVNKKRFRGTCYKAANWKYVGTTTGRGRMDRDHSRNGMEPKDIYVYPLTAKFREYLAV